MENETFDTPLKFYVESYGCSYNTADAETMTGLMTQAGGIAVPVAEDAAVIIVNSCTVKDRTTLELRKRLTSLKSLPQNPIVILTGCAPRIPSQAQEFSEFPMIGPDNLSSLVTVVTQALRGKTISRIERLSVLSSRLSMPYRRHNDRIEIIPIAQGCLGSCSYCQTVLARGRLHSAPIECILSRVRSALEAGVRVFWLTAQDCGAYGLDIGSNLAELMNAVSSVIDSFGTTVSAECRVRVGMANPNHILSFISDFASALSHPAFYKFAHIPVQAGSDRVLSEMKRPYCVDQFRAEVATLRSAIPEISIATDIIAGFPGETDSEFDETLALMRELAPAVINRSRYSPRPHTLAARMPQLQSKVISSRSQQLARLHEELVCDDLGKMIGRTVLVTVEQGNLCRTDSYKPVAVEGSNIPDNTQLLHVLITGVSRFHMTGKIV